jgi:predicted MFS family arabinose efflux permease
MGVFGLTFLSMNAVAPAASEEIALRVDWPATFLVAGLFALVSVALSRRVGDRRPPVSRDGAATSLLEMALRPQQLRVTAAVSLVGVAMGAAFTFHQPFALELGMTHVRSFFVAYASAAVVMRLGFGGLIDRAGRRRVVLVTLALYLLVVGAMSALQPGWLPVFGAALGVAHGLFYPAYNALAVEAVSAHERGKLIGMFQAGFNFGVAAGALALGIVAERAGYPAVFWMAAGCLLLAWLIIFSSPETRRPA